MATQLLQRRGTAAEWAAANEILGEGQIGIDETNDIFKIGDGITPWADLNIYYITKQEQDATYIAFAVLDAVGDILVGNGPDGVVRLPMGEPGQQLKVKADATGLFWETPPEGDLSSRIPMSVVDAEGDLIVGSADNMVVRLPAGGAGQVLTIVGGVPTWVTPTGGSSVGFAEIFLHGGS